MYRFLLLLVLSAACTRDLPPAERAVLAVQKNDRLQHISIATDSAGKNTLETIPVEIRLTYSGSYCNGAYPSDEMLEEIRQPRPLNELNIVLKNDASTYPLTTDSRGRITTNLKPGMYKLFFSEGNDAETAPFNVSCKKYYDQSWGALSIDSSRNNYKLHVEFPCDLCDEYAKMRP